MAIRTSGLDHIHINVRDLTGFMDLFDRLFEGAHTVHSEIESIEAFNATFRFSDATSSPFLDVFEAAGGQGPVARTVELRGEGVAILSFRVDDIDTAAAHAVDCGVREVSRIGFPGVMKQVQFHPADTFGFQLELVEYLPGYEEHIAEIQRKKAAGEAVEGLRVRDEGERGAR
jgi:hypothetical protein